PWASSSGVAIVGSWIGSYGKRGEVDCGGKKSMVVIAAIVIMFRILSPNFVFPPPQSLGARGAREPVSVNSCCSQTLNHWLDGELLQFRLIVGSSGRARLVRVSALLPGIGAGLVMGDGLDM